MSGSIKKIIKKIPFVGSYVKKVQTEKKEEEQKQKLEKKRLELQKEQERIKVWLKSEKQNAPDKNSRKISVIVHHHTGEEQLQKLKENFKEAAAGLEFEVFTADIESKQNTSFAEFCIIGFGFSGFLQIIQYFFFRGRKNKSVRLISGIMYDRDRSLVR